MSTRQQGEIRATVRSMRRRGRVAAVVFGLTIAGLVVAVLVLSSRTDGDSTGKAPMIAVGAVAAVACGLFAVSMLVGRVRSRDLRSETVTALTGRARTTEKRRHGSDGAGLIEYRLEVDGSRILLPTRAQLEAFVDGAAYTVYVVRAPGSPLLLSAEAIGA